MDQNTQERLDAILEEEIRRGYRVKAVPQSVRDLLKGEGLPDMAFVRFTRLNPRRRSKISEAVQRRYHADLKNVDILSNDQIAKFTEEKGEWTKAQSERMLGLLEETQRLQGELYIEGLAEQNWQTDMRNAVQVLRDELSKAEWIDEAEKEETLATFGRWADFNPGLKELYTKLYAEKQGLTEYSVDRDLVYLLERAPSEAAAEAFQLYEDLRDKVMRYIDLQTKRTELNLLQNKHAKIFADSVESRRDQAEEMARVYFCSERCDTEDRAIGPIAPSFDELWDFPEDAIQWLIIEHYFFANGLPDAAREYLETFGFLKADRAAVAVQTPVGGASTPSDASPAPQSSKGALRPQAATDPSSSA